MNYKTKAAFAEALPAVYLRIAGWQAGICWTMGIIIRSIVLMAQGKVIFRSVEK